MTFKELQKEAVDWANYTFGVSDNKAKVLHLWEELDEILIETKTKKGKLEVADVGLIFMHLADDLKIDLPEPSKELCAIMEEKFLVCKNREWHPPDENGVVRHIK